MPNSMTRNPPPHKNFWLACLDSNQDLRGQSAAGLPIATTGQRPRVESNDHAQASETQGQIRWRRLNANFHIGNRRAAGETRTPIPQVRTLLLFRFSYGGKIIQTSCRLNLRRRIIVPLLGVEPSPFAL